MRILSEYLSKKKKHCERDFGIILDRSLIRNKILLMGFLNKSNGIDFVRGEMALELKNF